MIWKYFMTTAILAYGPLLLASGFQPTGKPAHLHCVGSKGQLTLDADQDQKELKLALIIEGRTHLIEIDSITAARKSSTADVTVTNFTYDDPSQNFVDIDGSFEKPNWVPPSTHCSPSRAVDAPCRVIQDPGYWGTILSNEVLIGFKQNPDDNSSYLLDVVRAEAYGIQSWNPIGEKAVCEGELL